MFNLHVKQAATGSVARLGGKYGPIWHPWLHVQVIFVEKHLETPLKLVEMQSYDAQTVFSVPVK